MSDVFEVGSIGFSLFFPVVWKASVPIWCFHFFPFIFIYIGCF